MRAASVSILVPYRTDEPHRVTAWRFTRNWWASHHPDWQVVTGSGPDGPWVKALAVADALARADGQVLVIADADVICPRVDLAVAALAAGARWAIPHRGVYRLTQKATAAVLAGEPLPDVTLRRPGPAVVAEAYTGVAGGGIVALPRSVYEQVPLDPRFVGWGQEDASWGHALTVIAGVPWRGTAPLYHLWHPPMPRRSRAVGNLDGLALHRRYRQAATPDRMAALINEARHAC